MGRKVGRIWDKLGESLYIYGLYILYEKYLASKYKKRKKKKAKGKPLGRKRFGMSNKPAPRGRSFLS